VTVLNHFPNFPFVCCCSLLHCYFFCRCSVGRV